MKNQRIVGGVLVLLSIVIVVLAAQGATPEEKDITPVLFTLPLGVYALFTQQRIVFPLQEEKETTGEAATSTGGKRSR